MPKTNRGRKRAEPTTKQADQFVTPKPPEDLGDYGKQYWREHADLLVELRILTPLHVQTFRVLCEQWQTYRALSIWLDADPARYTFVTESGYESETPQVRQRDKALAALQKLWLKFGLTPHALHQLGKHGGVGRQQLPKIAQFAQSKYQASN